MQTGTRNCKAADGEQSFETNTIEKLPGTYGANPQVVKLANSAPDTLDMHSDARCDNSLNWSFFVGEI